MTTGAQKFRNSTRTRLLDAQVRRPIPRVMCLHIRPARTTTGCCVECVLERLQIKPDMETDE